jgi:hypothetical protein
MAVGEDIGAVSEVDPGSWTIRRDTAPTARPKAPPICSGVGLRGRSTDRQEARGRHGASTQQAPTTTQKRSLTTGRTCIAYAIVLVNLYASEERCLVERRDGYYHSDALPSCTRATAQEDGHAGPANGTATSPQQCPKWTIDN